jgi:hypothetical protein
MSKYLLDKFLFDVDRDPELTEAYRADPEALVDRWERTGMRRLTGVAAEETTWTRLTDEERAALVAQDYVAIQELGGHPFLTLTLFIAMFERDHGPLEYQLAYARAMEHITLPYPDIST